MERNIRPLLQYLIDLNKGKVLQGVQGYGVSSLFAIREITKEQYFEKRQNTWDWSNGLAVWLCKPYHIAIKLQQNFIGLINHTAC